MTTNDDGWTPRAATWDEIETGFHEYAADLTKQELEWDGGQTSFPPEFADWKVGMAAARRWLAAHDARVRRDAWTEGCRAAEQYYRRTVVGIPGLDPIPAPVNPHEENP